MSKRQLVAGVLSASLLVSALPGLAFAQDEGPFAAEGVEWTLSSMGGEDVPDGVTVTLLLDGGQASGNAGCNTYNGTYEIGPETLTFADRFAVTAMLCQGPAQDTEDAYLPMLQATAGWSVEDGVLTLSDADGNATLVYGVAPDTPVDVTSGDVAELQATLEALQGQIDQAETDIAALVEAAEAIPINKFDNRLTRTQEKVAALEEKTTGLNVSNLKRRISANEKAIADINNVITKLRKRIAALEAIAEDHEARIAVLEENVPIPEPF
jgi:heat shock protein HslJ